MRDKLVWLTWLGLGKAARLAERRGEPWARAKRAALAWGVSATLLVSYDVLTGIFPLGLVGGLVMLLLAIPLGGIPGFALESLAFKLGSTYGRRVALTFIGSTLVFVYLSVGMNVVATLLGSTEVSNMLRQVLVCVVAACPVFLGSWLYFRGMVAPRTQQLFLGVALLALALAPAIADHIISIEEYRAIHTVLRWSAVAGMGSGIFMLLPEKLEVPSFCVAGLVPAFVAGFVLFPYARPEFAPGMQTHPFGRLVFESARSVVDFDGDGYAQWLGYGDCAPFDAKINPGRPEIPGNGIDDNCRLGDAPRLPAAQPAPEGAVTVPEDAPSILLITTDALRADHVSSYGYERPTTPRLDAWAQQAALFTSAYTPGTRTGATLPALHYGVWAERLVWTPLFEAKREDLVARDDLRPRELVRRAIGFALDQPRPSLPRLLRERGYRTAAIVDDGTSPFLDLRPGFLRDYDSYWQMKVGRGHAYGDEVTSAKARETLKALAGGRFFLWVHFFGTHTPTTRTKGIPDFGFDKVGGYDHEIRAWDEALSKLLADADELAKTRKLVIVVSSDHGEVFTPLGRAHGVSAEEANFHVPLIVRAPGMPIGKSDAFVSSLDLVPMLLDLTGGTRGLQLDGLDLRELAMHPERTKDRVLFTNASNFNKDLSPQLNLSVGLGWGRKVVFDQLRNQVTVWKLGDFSDQLVAPDAASDRVLRALMAHIEVTPGMLIAPDR
jgi:arylsulfatase A-like enzyme